MNEITVWIVNIIIAGLIVWLVAGHPKQDFLFFNAWVHGQSINCEVQK